MCCVCLNLYYLYHLCECMCRTHFFVLYNSILSRPFLISYYTLSAMLSCYIWCVILKKKYNQHTLFFLLQRPVFGRSVFDNVFILLIYEATYCMLPAVMQCWLWVCVQRQCMIIALQKYIEVIRRIRIEEYPCMLSMRGGIHREQKI